MQFIIIHSEKIAYSFSICIKISDLEWPWTAYCRRASSLR